jgi:hypothetical protein
MGFIEEMAKAKAFDDMQTKQVTDAMTAAGRALEEQRMARLPQVVPGGMTGLAGASAIPRVPVQQVVPSNPTQQVLPVVPNQGLASIAAR